MLALTFGPVRIYLRGTLRPRTYVDRDAWELKEEVRVSSTVYLAWETEPSAL